jgi:4-hydroxy-tetrahydrodipicolinate synthase
MSKIDGIYAASMSVINKDLTLDVTKTIQHAETIIGQGCHGAGNIWKHRSSSVNIN